MSLLNNYNTFIPELGECFYICGVFGPEQAYIQYSVWYSFGIGYKNTE